MADSLIGRTIGKYKVVERLGRGGMAEVYKAHQEALDRYVAIKLMHSFLADDQDFLSRFKREARSMAALNHPNIVSVYDFDVEGKQTYYLVMEFVAGGTLKEKLEALARQGEQLSLAQAIRIVLEIADALSYAHGRGMIHRDIKPANIMLAEDGRAVLTDFGIAKMLSGPSYTATGAMIGTPAYMSPEQGLGQPGDERSDLYSLGVLFFQMATGRLPFDADTPLAVVLKHVNEPVPTPNLLNPQLPQAIQNTITKSMAKNPDERFQTAHEMAQAIRGAVRSDDISLATALPAELLQDRPTPAPLATSAGLTRARPLRDATQAATPVAETAVTAGHTEIAKPPARPGLSQVAPAPKRSPWIWLAGGGALLFILLALFAAGIAVASRLFEATPEAIAVADEIGTATVTPPPVSTPVSAVTEVDVAAQVNAALTAAAADLTATAAAKPTSTSTSTATATATVTATPDVTATLLAGCVPDVELVVAHTYANRQVLSAPVRASFPMNWILRNKGTCPWPADLQWTYQDGEAFGDTRLVALPSETAVNAEVTLQATFTAPATARAYETIWQFTDGAGNAYGPEIAVTVSIYVPATPTPVPPTPTVGPTVTPTREAVAVGFNIFPDRNCEYPGGGTEWRCQMLITPFGGGGGPYTIWIFDSAQPAEYRGGGNTYHFISRARCHPWNHEIKVQDDASGESFSRAFFIDPTNLTTFPSGGCTVP
jgi:serine/threonine protein kinase